MANVVSNENNKFLVGIYRDSGDLLCATIVNALSSERAIDIAKADYRRAGTSSVDDDDYFTYNVLPIV